MPQRASTAGRGAPKAANQPPRPSHAMPAEQLAEGLKASSAKTAGWADADSEREEALSDELHRTVQDPFRLFSQYLPLAPVKRRRAAGTSACLLARICARAHRIESTNIQRHKNKQTNKQTNKHINT